MSSQRDRDEQKKREKLADIQDQIEQGKLTIRKMTAKERKENPPRPPKQKPPRGGRR